MIVDPNSEPFAGFTKDFMMLRINAAMIYLNSKYDTFFLISHTTQKPFIMAFIIILSLSLQPYQTSIFQILSPRVITFMTYH